MQFQLSYAPKKYLSAMREQMGPRFSLSERFTGFFAGRVFYVTHHADYEWNRRLTNQKNAAIGIVKQAESGCHVHFVCFRGLLCPLMFLSFLILTQAICLLAEGFGSIPVRLGIGLAITAVVTPIEALFESMTQRSEEGHKSLLSFLLDPADPYANYRNIP